jgi:hypothetical protein
MTDSKDIVIGIGTVVVVVIGLLGVYRQQTSQKKQTIRENQKKNLMVENELNIHLGNIKKELKKSAIAYYLDSHYRDYNLTESQIEELQRKYPPILSRPSIDWKTIGYDNNKQEILEKKLSEIVKDRSSTTSYGLKSTFEKESLEEAEQEVVEILKNMAKQK